MVVLPLGPIDLELTGAAQGAIVGSELSSQLFATLIVMLPGTAAKAMSVLIVILMMTYLVTSADSAIYVVNTINAAGDTTQKSPVHIMIWGVVLTLVIAVLMLAGGLLAIQTAMIIDALPFSIVLGLMVVARSSLPSRPTATRPAGASMHWECRVSRRLRSSRSGLGTASQPAYRRLGEALRMNDARGCQDSHPLASMFDVKENAIVVVNKLACTLRNSPIVPRSPRGRSRERPRLDTG